MLSQYIKEISKIELLSEEEEKNLWKEYKEQNDLNCRLKIIEAYQPFVFKLVMNMQPRQELILDLVQEATLGLMEAVERYNPNREINFSTYASFRIRGQIVNYLRKYNIESISLDHAFSDDEDGYSLIELFGTDLDSQDSSMEKVSWSEPIRKALERLSDKEKKVIRGIFFESRSPQQVSKELNISLGHTYRLQKKAIRRIRGMLSKLKHKTKIDEQV